MLFCSRYLQLDFKVIAAHSIHPSLHRVLLEEVPRAKVSKSIHQGFEREYWSLYTKLIVANEVSGANARSIVRAQVLSAALSGVVHDAARKRGKSGLPVRGSKRNSPPIDE